MKFYQSIEGKLPEGFEMPSIIVAKECYNNTMLFAIRNAELFKMKNMKIAYGFFNKPSLATNLWIRHCFILDNDDNVIDVTLFNDKDRTKNRYIIFKTFKNVSEINSIPEYKKDTSLGKSLLEYEKDLVLPYLDENMKDMISRSAHSQDVILMNI